MDWKTSLQEQQADFIVRIESDPNRLLRWGRGKHGELKVISADILQQLRELCWLMVDRYKNTKATARQIFRHQLQGKLGEEVTKECLGVFYYRIKYDIILGGDGKVELTLTNGETIGIRVKTSYGQQDQVTWLLTPEQVKQNQVLVWILLQQNDYSPEFDEFKSEYSPIMAGFLPTKWVKRMLEEGEVKPELVNGKKFVKLRLKNLLYGGGLRSYLENLASKKGAKTSKELEGLNDEQKVSLSNLNLAQSYYNRGVDRYKAGDKLGAIEDYGKAIKYNPQFIKAYYNQNIAHYQERNNQEALADYNKAIDLNPNHAKAYYNRGIVRSEMGKYQAALGDWTGEISLDSKFTQAYYNRGNAYLEMGDIQKAIDDYTKAIKINPDFTQAIEKLEFAQSKLWCGVSPRGRALR